mgnify:CR=1 FL=1|tara:strand:+ start:486 stop:878 length:393 start_codon:yes stop_codon:yes gene_type:complete
MIFETNEDLENEFNVIKKIAKDNKIIKLSKFDIDYEIVGKAYIEIKCYKIKSNQFSHTIVSLIKLVKMQKASKKLPTFLFIQFIDDLKYINIKDIAGEIKVGGRKPRKGSTNDLEFLCYVDTNKFKTFKN